MAKYNVVYTVEVHDNEKLREAWEAFDDNRDCTAEYLRGLQPHQAMESYLADVINSGMPPLCAGFEIQDVRLEELADND